MTENIITQVTADHGPVIPQHAQDESPVDYNSKIHLNIRGREFTITRDELMSLPESILLCLFPNGVFLDENGQVITNLTEDDVVYVNFAPECFEYIISTFNEAQKDLQELNALSPPVSSPGRLPLLDNANVLHNKPGIIVLREDLDFYVISPVSGLTGDQIRHLKIEVSQELVKNKLVFNGLGYDPTTPAPAEQKLGPAEKHLFDMLCSSGFEPSGTWGTRFLEPSRCVILSLLLVRLKTKPPTPPESPQLKPMESNVSITSRKSRSRLATLASSASRAASRSMSRSRKTTDINQTKLLLFWRKPARKCWWSNQIITVNASGVVQDHKTLDVKVHIRRVWTLELSVVGVQ